MFYKDLYNFLITDSAIAATVTTYKGVPSIFANEAPEGADKPYITFSISTTTLPDSVIVDGTVDIDYWDFGVSRTQADTAANAIEDRVDMKNLRANSLTDIRFRMSSSGHVPSTDSRDIHHNTTFDARGARIRWMKKNFTT